jgi:hydrogenase maturation protein HypF
MAAAHLRAAGESLAPIAVDAAALRGVEQLLDRGFNSPPTSSMGRLFDAVAALTGACLHASFDGEAAMRLEALAASAPFDAGYPVVCDGELVRADPLIVEVARDLRAGIAAPQIARRFHSWVVELIVHAATGLARRHQLDRVALSGGVFVNRIVAGEAAARLAATGLTVLCHRVVPPGDGGLALGQLAIAAAQDGGQGACA